MKKKYDLVVFGATGFTGSLVCEYLFHNNDSKKINWAISGRNKKKLEKLSKEFSVDMILSDSFNKESLNRMCA